MEVHLSFHAHNPSLREMTQASLGTVLNYFILFRSVFSKERHKDKGPFPNTPRLMSLTVPVDSSSDEVGCHRTEQSTVIRIDSV